MSENEIFPKAEFFRKPNFPNYEFNTRHDNREVTLIEFFESRICPNNYFRKPNLSEYLPNVPKCGLNTRHDNREVTLFHFYSFDTSANFALWQMRHRFNPRKRVNDYQRYSMLTALPLRSMSCTLGNSSSFQAAGTTILGGITIHWALRRILWKIFLYLMMTNVMVKTCLNQKITKNSNLIQAIKNSVCPTANVTRRPIFSESRIFRRLRIVDSTHDMIIVKWHLLNFSKAEFVRIFTECSEVWIPKCGLNTRHDNREVTLIHLTRAQTLPSANFALWQMRHRFNPRKWVNDYQRYSMLTVLPLRFMSCTIGNSYSLEAAGDDHTCRYYNPLSAKKDIIIINLMSDLRFYSWRVCIVMFLELSILIDIWSSFRVLSELSPWVITRWIKKIMLTNPLNSKTNLNT